MLNPGAAGRCHEGSVIRFAPLMTTWTPSFAGHHPRIGLRPERYVLRLQGGGAFIGINAADQHLQEVSAPERAHQFRSHEGALQRAQVVTAVMGSPVDVVRLR